jgi:hypothetical protein
MGMMEIVLFIIETILPLYQLISVRGYCRPQMQCFAAGTMNKLLTRNYGMEEKRCKVQGEERAAMEDRFDKGLNLMTDEEGKVSFEGRRESSHS